MIFRLVSAAHERGDFLSLPLPFASHDRMEALNVVRHLTACKATSMSWAHAEPEKGNETSLVGQNPPARLRRVGPL